MSAPSVTYAYHATYLANHDGDTVMFDVDRGQLTHGIWDRPRWTVRLYGIDTWEMTGKDHPKGVLARDFTQTVLLGARRITVQTIHPDLRPPELEKYGRILAHVFADDEDLADLLRAAGHEKQLGPII
jgi:endonuclease YncB( thermonuclease family)